MTNLGPIDPSMDYNYETVEWKVPPSLLISPSKVIQMPV
jgi:hypothetical protein